MPRLGLRWAGFRRVHRQVCKRIARRLTALGLTDLAAYRARLRDRPEEWEVLDGLCRVTISRFYRDPEVFDALRRRVIPACAARAAPRGVLRAWSAGCGSGEEPYSLSLIWCMTPAPGRPRLAFEVRATDVDPVLLERARAACYPRATLDALPEAWRDAAFDAQDDTWCLRARYREGVRFEREDVRSASPQGLFDLVLCRNLAFTYFTEHVQRRVLERLCAHMVAGGALVIGRDESLPPHAAGLEPWGAARGIYRRTAGACSTPLSAPRG